MSKIKLIQGDCLEKMKDIPNASFDLTLTSPPYNMNLRIRNGKYCSRQIIKELSTKYERYADNLPMQEYYEFNRKVIKELLRISDLVFYNVQFLTGNKPALFKIIGEFHDKIKEFIVWDKINSQPAIRDKVLNSRFEAILVLQNNGAKARRFETANFQRGTLENLWQIKRGTKVSDSHAAVFPLELAELVISNFSNNQAKIFDPFMGTGTTGVACKNLNRDFIGIELDTEYYKIAEKRINESLQN